MVITIRSRNSRSVSNTKIIEKHFAMFEVFHGMTVKGLTLVKVTVVVLRSNALSPSKAKAYDSETQISLMLFGRVLSESLALL
jgi:hypothetical protein